MSALDSRTISPEVRRQIAAGARAEAARRSLYEMMRQGWDTIEPGVPLEGDWHVIAFCSFVQSMLEGWLVANGKGTAAMRARVIESWHSHGLDYIEGELLVQNAVANLCPGTLKSRILMVFAPAWIWLHCPTWKLCAISGVELNVKRDSDDCRKLIESPWYRRTFGIDWKIHRRADAVNDWKTTAGGERKSRTMGGNFQGVHADGIFLDDPDDAQRVHNEPARAEVQWKWKRSIRNRIKHANRSIRISCQQRVHVDDWTAAQLANGVWSPDDRKAWAWLCIPLLFARGPDDAPILTPWGWRDPRRIANENMQPSRFPDAVIADEIRDRGEEGFEGQYNQNPASLQGGMIPRSYIRFFRVEDDEVTTKRRPMGCGLGPDGEPEPAIVVKRKPNGGLDLDWLTMSVDCSNGSEQLTASAVGIGVVGGKGGQRFVFDDRTAIMSIGTMYTEIKAAIAAWPLDKVLIELKAAGSSVINDLKKALADGTLVGPDGLPTTVEIVPITDVRDSKEGRAAAMVSSWRNGMVYLLDGAHWLYPQIAGGGKTIDQGFVGEITTFPKSKRDDRVDYLSQLFSYYRMKVDNKSRWRALARA